jgi:hypothetical protein
MNYLPWLTLSLPSSQDYRHELQPSDKIGYLKQRYVLVHFCYCNKILEAEYFIRKECGGEITWQDRKPESDSRVRLTSYNDLFS